MRAIRGYLLGLVEAVSLYGEQSTVGAVWTMGVIGWESL